MSIGRSLHSPFATCMYIYELVTYGSSYGLFNRQYNRFFHFDLRENTIQRKIIRFIYKVLQPTFSLAKQKKLPHCRNISKIQ
jgi:hypothetical protein